MLIKKKKFSETEEPLQQDKRLIAKIQPQGGITFNDEKLIKTGDGYEMILHIYRYPKYIDRFWLTQIVNIDNVVVTIDIETKDQQKVKQNINNFISDRLLSQITCAVIDKFADNAFCIGRFEIYSDKCLSIHKITLICKAIKSKPDLGFRAYTAYIILTIFWELINNCVQLFSG